MSSKWDDAWASGKKLTRSGLQNGGAVGAHTEVPESFSHQDSEGTLSAPHDWAPINACSLDCKPRRPCEPGL